MNPTKLYRFLRPTLIVVLSYLMAIIGSHWLTRQTTPSSAHSVDPWLNRFITQTDSLRYPDPTIPPDEVVRIQIAGLSSGEKAQGVLQCMLFASPGNRVVTGPLERFGRMVRSPEYQALSHPDRVLVGNPTVLGNNVRVMVTLVARRELSSYVWVLSKQTVPPFADCWMTDGVFRLSSPQHDAGRPGRSNRTI